MKKIGNIIIVLLLLVGLTFPIIPVSAFSATVTDFDRIWYSQQAGFNKNGEGQLVLAVTYTNATVQDPNFRNIDYAYIEFTQDPFYFGITFEDELEIIRDSEGNIIYQEPEDGYVFLRKSFVDNYLPQNIKRLASRNINYKTITFQGIKWYRIYVPDFNRKYEWKKYTEPSLDEKWYTWGSNESIMFSERAMYVELTKEEIGSLLFSFTHPSDNSGQIIAISKSYFLSKGITKPYFEWGEVRPWKPIGYTENATHYFISPEHFSWIGAHETSSGEFNSTIVSDSRDNVIANFTTFTEVDPNNRWTINNATRVTVTNSDRDERDYVYKDYGVDFFISPWEHNFTVRITSTTEKGFVYFYILANEIDDYGNLTNGISVSFYILPDANYVEITLRDRTGIIDDCQFAHSGSKSYYMTVSRSDTTLRLYIYDDEARTTPASPTSGSVPLGITMVDLDYRYLYAGSGACGVLSGLPISGYIENLSIGCPQSFVCTRTVAITTEVNNFSFTSSYNYSGNVTFIVPVSTDVTAILDVTNNTAGLEATAVNSTDELVNNTYFFDSTNFDVYIRTVNLTTSSTVNWTINCSYASEFSISIPAFKDVGDDIFLQGVLKDVNGLGLDGIMAKSYIYYSNNTVAVGPVEWNCTNGNFQTIITTTALMPGIYRIVIKFTDLDNITSEIGKNLYLSYPTPYGVYSDALVFFNFYNTNEGLGLPTETLKIYVDDARQYETTYYAYTGEEINVVIKDYYNLSMYDGNFTINQTYTYLDFGLTFHSYKFSNLNEEYYMISFLKNNGSRWFERGICPYETVEFLLPSGDYSLRIYDADNDTLYNNDSISMINSKLYVLNGSHLELVIDGQSVIVGDLLELSEELYDATMPDVVSVVGNPPWIWWLFDNEGAQIGIKLVCPSKLVFATTRNSSYVNATETIIYPLIPDTSTDNGTISVKKDTLYFAGPGNTSWVNVSYDSTENNYSYIPNPINLFGENVTVNSSHNVSFLRETRYQQLKKFYWTKYSAGYQDHDTDYYEATVNVHNPLDVTIYEVHVSIELANDDHEEYGTLPDTATLDVYDVTNGVYLTVGENFVASMQNIEFGLDSLATGVTRRFTCSYSVVEESQMSKDAIVSVNTYNMKMMNNKNYYHLKAQWVNPYSDTFIGSLDIKFNFSTYPYEIAPHSFIVFDNENNRYLDYDEFVYLGSGMTISQDIIGSVSPNSARTFDVYFLFVSEEEEDGVIHAKSFLHRALLPSFYGFVFELYHLFAILLFFGIAVPAKRYFDKSTEKRKRETYLAWLCLIFLFLLTIFYFKGF